MAELLSLGDIGMIAMFLILVVCAIYCLLVLRFTRRLPFWLRQLTRAFFISLIFPVLVVHEGGAAFAPPIFLLLGGVLERDDIQSFCIQVVCVWAALFFISLLCAGIRYLARRNSHHVA